jgi:hypothetical protein
MRSSSVKLTLGLVVLVSLMASPLAGGRSENQKRARQLLKGASKVLAARTAVKLAALLPRLLERFRTQREELLDRGGGSAYPKDGLATLLDSTESSLEKELRKSELAPMRAYVREVFATARDDLGLPSRTAFVTPPVPRVALASLRLAPQEPAASDARLDRENADPVIDKVIVFLEDVYRRAKQNDLTLALCLVSDPDGFIISLHVEGEKETYQGKTNGLLPDLTRGEYIYQVRKKRKIVIEGGAIGLWARRQPVLDCNLDEGLCLVREGWPASCRGR